MEDIRSVSLRHLQGRLRQITGELTKVRYTSSPAPEAWHPAINAYRCRDSIVVCVELAGVEKSQIELRVEPRRVWLRGRVAYWRLFWGTLLRRPRHFPRVIEFAIVGHHFRRVAKQL